MPNPYDRLGAVETFQVDSDDVATGKEMPVPHRSGVFGAGGDDLSPHLSWSGFDAGTKSFVVSMYDPAAPTPSGFWHWMVADIPATVTALASGAGDAADSLPAGAVAIRNDAGSTHYIGSAPPSGVHDYYLAVHALDVESLGVTSESSPALVSFSMLGHILGRALIIPTSSASAIEGVLQ